MLNHFFTLLVVIEQKFYQDDYSSSLLKLPIDYLNHNEAYEEALIKANRMFLKASTLENPGELLAIAEALHYEASPLLLHFVMFIPALMSHCSPEQQAIWLPDAIDLKIIGTYAQTELGHGSYLKGLQTRADYDSKTQTFILNSPTLESIKWWPGGLGKTANFAIVLAQLYTDNIHRGLHPFIVQLRDLETHKPLKGIVIGEIGPKMGLRAADNGYLQLNHVAIPKNHMLMRYAKIDENGTYFARDNKDKLNYGTMLFVRIILIELISANVSKAVTIAVRYSAVRRQGLNPDKFDASKEIQIIDYQAQKYKLIPSICIAHSLKAVSILLFNAFKDTNEVVERSKELGETPLLHAISSGMKALASDIGSNAIEVCRKACGGHGFMLISGLPRLYANTVAVCTYEGENTILYLQTAHYLYKISKSHSFREKSKNKIASHLDYVFNLKEAQISSEQFSKPLSISTLVHLQACSASYFIRKAFERFAHEERQNRSFEQAWINSQTQLIKAAKRFLTYFLVSNYFEWVQNAQPFDANIYQILSKLCFFFNLYLIVKNSGDFFAIGLELKYFNQIHDEMLNLMDEIRPDMVALVDAFDLHDMVLMSALGRYFYLNIFSAMATHACFSI